MAAEAGASAAGGAEQKQKTAMEAWNDLKAKHKHRFVIFKLVNKEVVVDVLGDVRAGGVSRHAPLSLTRALALSLSRARRPLPQKSATYKTFISNLPETSCRYAVYDYEFKTKDGRSSAKIYFFTWSASRSPPRCLPRSRAHPTAPCARARARTQEPGERQPD